MTLHFHKLIKFFNRANLHHSKMRSFTSEIQQIAFSHRKHSSNVEASNFIRTRENLKPNFQL